MKKGKILLSIVNFLFVLSSITFANGLNLNGIGARAVAMGGAFVGLADDFSVIFWNPAGITQFNQKAFGLAGDLIMPSSTFKYDLSGTTLVNAQTVSKSYFAGMAAYYHPINENLVVGIGVYNPVGLGIIWEGDDFASITGGTAYEWESYIGAITFSPALAYKINEQISVGAALNINYGLFNLSNHAGFAWEAFDLGQQKIRLKGYGIGATFGILVKPHKKFNLGVTFRTPTKMSFSGDAEISQLNVLDMIPGTPISGTTINTTSDVAGDVTLPLWLCGGIAFKPIENLILTADVQYTNWAKIDVIKLEPEDSFWQSINAATDSQIQLDMRWENCIQIRFGAEYKIKNISLRGGYYKDPSPAPNETMNILVPNYDFNSFSVGFGYPFKGIQFDFTLEYLIGKDRDIPYLLADPDKYNSPGYYTMKIWAPNLSISYSW